MCVCATNLQLLPSLVGADCYPLRVCACPCVSVYPPPPSPDGLTRQTIAGGTDKGFPMGVKEVLWW